MVRIAIDRHGAPQKFLSDNGAALNPTRQGPHRSLGGIPEALGVEPITGKPYKPTTQGKNERFHQTLHRYLNSHPQAATIAELQAQVDVFDTYYNTEREHQALPPGTTPAEAWNATAKACRPSLRPRNRQPKPRQSVQRKVGRQGEVTVIGMHFYIGTNNAGEQIHVLHDDETIMFFDTRGTEIISHPRPPKGTDDIGLNGPGRQPCTKA